MRVQDRLTADATYAFYLDRQNRERIALERINQCDCQAICRIET